MTWKEKCHLCLITAPLVYSSRLQAENKICLLLQISMVLILVKGLFWNICLEEAAPWEQIWCLVQAAILHLLSLWFHLFVLLLYCDHFTGNNISKYLLSTLSLPFSPFLLINMLSNHGLLHFRLKLINIHLSFLPYSPPSLLSFFFSFNQTALLGNFQSTRLHSFPWDPRFSQAFLYFQLSCYFLSWYIYIIVSLN